ncbi:MAG: hypothetical protein QOE70_1596 [Chthoniobacter sp.]|nr:hypothetical protein [Chthoniobacter sp.]
MRHLLGLLIAFALISSGQLALAKAPPAKPWFTLEHVLYKPQRWDDGDSFHVTTADGNELILRLYFVDTPEEAKVYADRIRDQAAYFGVSEADVMALGHRASAFTREVLSKPFTVQTRWHKALGRSKWDRWYCQIVTADGKDLAEELVRNGLARIYGTRTILPDGRDSKTYLLNLKTIEDQAKAAKRGGWGKGA